MSSPWFIPDAQQWRVEEGYNPAVPTALDCVARKFLQDGGVASDLLDCVAPVIAAAMAKSQRLRVLYVVCLCLAAEDPPDRALPPLREALALAKELGETHARIDLLMQRAYVNRYITQIPAAANDLRECLEVFEELKRRGEWGPEDTTRMLTVLVRLASQEFLLGDIAACEASLARADDVLAQVGEHLDSQARLAWNHALLARWRGEYDAALTQSVAAVGYYQQLHDPEMLSRIEGATGEILLDLAEQSRAYGDEETCAGYLVRAEQYIERAIQIAMDNDYQGSECSARIIRARLLLLQGTPGDRTLLLEELANRGKQHRDMALVCKAYTGIGRECEAVGDLTAAKEWYRRAIPTLKESQNVADIIWAQRALWRLEGEMKSDDPPAADHSPQN